jgi:hypothetical protein
MSDTYDVLRAQADDYAETSQTAKAMETYLSWTRLWRGGPTRRIISATQPASPALGPLLPASSGEAGVTQKPNAWKHSAQIYGITGMGSFPMLSFCFANP